MKTNELIEFLYDLNLAGYASGEEKKWTKENDCSTTIPFKKGKFRSHDNFFGGEPYGGRIVVFYEEKPVWIMVYYGLIKSKDDPNKVYVVLREALKKMPKDYPFRGPKQLKAKEYEYINSWKGTVERYSGREKIVKNNKTIYSAFYCGGLVDMRRGV